MQHIKICPDCNTEYFPHIHKCADCGAVLLLPEENERVQEERKRLKDSALEDPVMLREGDLKWMDELYTVLIDSGIACVVNADAGCNKGCCGDTYRLLVSSRDAERAHERIEDYCMEVHPEIRVSRELAGQGKCPACGSPVRPDAVECKDCGLILFIVEE